MGRFISIYYSIKWFITYSYDLRSSLVMIEELRSWSYYDNSLPIFEI